MTERLIRVVLYAEGPGELAGVGSPHLAPGRPLPEETLGPGHLLVRRCIYESAGTDVAVQFEEPLRDRRGRVIRGSMLLHKQTLRQILTWPNLALRPDVAVVLVDQDDDSHRKRELEKTVQGLLSNPALGVAIQEFEAWLIADHACAASVLESDLQQPKNPERMKRREAKELLALWIDTSETGLSGTEVRCQIADRSDLAIIERVCRAFSAFRRELGERCQP